MEPLPFPTPTVVRGGCKKLSILRPDGNTRECLCMISGNGTVYELERKLCDAIYGQVRAACVLGDIGNKVYSRTDAFVAIKILNMEKIRSKMGTLTEDPLKELAALQFIGNAHPYIQGQIECVQDQHNIYSVMNLCTGGELLDYVLMNQLSELDGRNIFKQILSGVEYMQSKGVTHRDLSLENILLTREGYCKIIDMGQSLRVPIDSSGLLARLPPSGMCGKLPYRAPEIFQNQIFDGFAIDVWSLGIILFMLLTGQQPVDYPDRSCDRYTYIVSGELRSLMTQWKLIISESAMDLIQNILQEDPSRRLTVSQIQAHPWMSE
jgi:serine/threonine protein kinase